MDRWLRGWSLNRRLILIVVLALLPLAVLGVVEGFAAKRKIDRLVDAQLTSGALAASLRQGIPINTARRVLIDLNRDKDVMAVTADCDAALKRRFVPGSGIINYARSDASGAIWCSGLPFQKGLSLAGERWWRPGIEARTFTLSEPTFGAISQRPVLIAMLPFYRADGAFAGAITAAIEIAWLERNLQKAQLSDSAIAAIADRNGLVLMASRSGGPRSVEVGGNVGLARSTRVPEGGLWRYAVAPLFEDSLYVVYMQQEGVLAGAARSQWLQSLVLPFVAMLFASLAVWLGIQRFVLRWLDELSEKARAIATGRYQFRPDRFRDAAPEIAEFAETLHQMAEDIGKRDADLRASLATSSKLARELNHRVKNNLQIVLSLLTLQTRRVENPEARQVIEHTRNRMNAVALAQRLTLDMDEHGDQGSVDIDRLMREFGIQLQANVVKQRGTVEVESTLGDATIDQAVPIVLFTLEAVTNAVVHGLQDKQGAVVVTLQAKGDQAHLTIEDDGYGFDPVDASPKMGFELMDALAAQLGGKCSRTSAPGRGSTLHLSFPKIL